MWLCMKKDKKEDKKKRRYFGLQGEKLRSAVKSFWTSD